MSNIIDFYDDNFNERFFPINDNNRQLSVHATVYIGIAEQYMNLSTFKPQHEW